MLTRLNIRKKTIAIKNFDEELYRIVKSYASLEGRTVSSIFKEAIRLWIESRGGYDEVRKWIMIEEGYRENMQILMENMDRLKDRRGYVLICDGKIHGIFGSYIEAARFAEEKCTIHSLIVKLPLKEKRIVEIGLPW